MASKFTTSKQRFLLFMMIIFFLLLLRRVYCSEFEVGERKGWVVPPANDTEMHNEWASKLRFKVGDTIRFKYKKDSVMEVNKTNYKECNSNRPNFFSNTGNTMYTLDRSGFFYFISGATGHCEKGQRMIVWVMAQDASHRTSLAPNIINHDFMISYGLLLVIMFAVQISYFQY